jgi:asparagine synthase (glutamine-hydrolysing)
MTGRRGPGNATGAEPFLLLRTSRESVEAHGTRQCVLGHVPTDPRPRGGGIFASWSWDGDTARVHNDRYGMYPFYYSASPDRLALSPSVNTLLSLGIPTDLDEAALAVFIRLGFFVGEDTPFRAIRALPPDATFEWRHGQLHVKGAPTLPRAQHFSRDAAIAGYIELFREAVFRQRVPDDDFAVPLSGGRDSRHILLELCRTGHRPRFAVTMRHFPPLSDEDATVAGQVAAALGVPHVVIAQNESRAAAEIIKNRITGFCTDEHAWMLPIAEYLQGRVRYVWDGIGGDVLSAGLFQNAERVALAAEGRFEDLAVALLEGRETCPRLLTPEWLRRLGRDVAIARLASELSRYAEAANPVQAFYFWNRTRRETALGPYRILARSVGILSPYLDHDLYDFLASFPATWVGDHALHTDTILRAYPRYSDLRFERPRIPPRWVPAHSRRLARELAVAVLRSLARRPATRPLRHSFLLTRSIRAALDGRGDRLEWIAPVVVLYLLQLADEMEHPQLETPLADRTGS